MDKDYLNDMAQAEIDDNVEAAGLCDIEVALKIEEDMAKEKVVFDVNEALDNMDTDDKIQIMGRLFNMINFKNKSSQTDIIADSQHFHRFQTKVKEMSVDEYNMKLKPFITFLKKI